MHKRHKLLLTAAMIATSIGVVAGAIAHQRGAPGEDFYAYANADWLARTRLPDGVARIDTTSQLRAQNAERVRRVIDEAVRATTRDRRRARPDVRKIADYYMAQRDAGAIERKGFAPLAQDIADIAALGDRRALASWLGRTMRLDDGNNQHTESLWGLWVHQGLHDPDHNAAHLVQGGLGLPDAAAYLDTGAAAATRRDAYRTRIAKLLALAGLDRAEARATGVLALETAIAKTHASRADTDDPFKTDTMWRRADFAGRAPGIDWDAFLSAAGLGAAPGFQIWQPGAVIGGARLVGEQPLQVWKDYLTFHLIDHYSVVLPRAAAADPDASPDPVSATQAVFADAIGRLYVERYFSPRAKAAATAMVENIRAAFRRRLSAADWLTPATRQRALAKLAALKLGLGYPDAWIDYSHLVITPDDAFGNLRRAEAFAYRREIARLREAPDPSEWSGLLHPQMVGAILALSPNAMQFAAGLLQPPYFDADGDPAANYGSAGAGIAHEISHSFDQVGNIYDARGRLGSWWGRLDLSRYAARTAPLAVQLDSCSPAPALRTRGMQVLDESAADVTGAAVAYDAYRLSLHGRPDSVRGGRTGDQRFFLAFAQRWRRVQTSDALRAQVESDNHAPPPCRSNLVRNFTPWVRAFGIRPGDALFVEPAARIRIW